MMIALETGLHLPDFILKQNKRITVDKEKKKIRIAAILSIFGGLALVHFYITMLFDLYYEFGWDAPLNIALVSLAISLVASLIAIIVKWRYAAGWLVFIPSLFTFIALIIFIANFRFKM